MSDRVLTKVITECRDCDHCSTMHDEFWFFCEKENRPTKALTIPDWCPLPKAGAEQADRLTQIEKALLADEFAECTIYRGCKQWGVAMRHRSGPKHVLHETLEGAIALALPKAGVEDLKR